MLDWWCSRGTVFVKTGSLRWILVLLQFNCAAVVRFFEIIFLNIRRSLSPNVDFGQLFLFADVVFPWFVYADVTVEILALNTPNNVAYFITDAPSKSPPTTSPLSNNVALHNIHYRDNFLLWFAGFSYIFKMTLEKGTTAARYSIKPAQRI
jgi:hypothetical protein